MQKYSIDEISGISYQLGVTTVTGATLYTKMESLQFGVDTISFVEKLYSQPDKI